MWLYYIIFAHYTLRESNVAMENSRCLDHVLLLKAPLRWEISQLSLVTPEGVCGLSWLIQIDNRQGDYWSFRWQCHTDQQFTERYPDRAGNGIEGLGGAKNNLQRFSRLHFLGQCVLAKSTCMFGTVRPIYPLTVMCKYVNIYWYNIISYNIIWYDIVFKLNQCSVFAVAPKTLQDSFLKSLKGFFEALDTDGSGSIHLEEIKIMLQDCRGFTAAKTFLENDIIHGAFLNGVAPSHHPFIDGFSLINHPFWDIPICGTPPCGDVSKPQTTTIFGGITIHSPAISV